MKFSVRLAVSFCEVVLLLLVCFLSGLALKVIPIQLVTDLLHIVYEDQDLPALMALLASLLLLMTHIMGRSISSLHERERNIAFDNPAGRVHVTLAALEDLIRRTLFELDEIRDAKVFVKVKKGSVLDVQTMRLVLNGDHNIPEMIAQVQKIIQKKIEDTIGAEQKVNIDVDVTKMVSHDKKKKKKFVTEAVDEGHNVPFQGYRA